MLNPFPIQFLALLAYLILRVFVGLALVYLGARHLQYRHELKHILKLSWWPFGAFTTWVFALGELTFGFMFLLGFYTQIAALLTAVMAVKMLLMRRWFSHHTIPQRMVYWLMLGASLTLFITGAGALAFDLPI